MAALRFAAVMANAGGAVSVYLRQPQVKAAAAAMIWGILANEAPQKLMEERVQKTTVRPVGEHG